MRVAVVGSRILPRGDARCDSFLTCIMSYLNPSEIVSGGAKGADRLGELWAEERGIPIQQYLPDWDGMGKAAGFRRNVQIVDHADCVVAIWDGHSSGTKHTIDLTIASKKPLYLYKF